MIKRKTIVTQIEGIPHNINKIATFSQFVFILPFTY